MGDRVKMRSKSGQAIVELVVALVVILVLVAGTIQISMMGVRHSRLMTEAREEAGRKSMMEASSFAGPRFISACTVGADNIAFSRDDGAEEGDIGMLTVGIVNYSRPGELDDIRPDNPLSALSESGFPQTMFGLVEGEETGDMDLIPIVRELIYRSNSVELKGKAWMTWAKGLY